MISNEQIAEVMGWKFYEEHPDFNYPVFYKLDRDQYFKASIFDVNKEGDAKEYFTKTLDRELRKIYND